MTPHYQFGQDVPTFARLCSLPCLTRPHHTNMPVQVVRVEFTTCWFSWVSRSDIVTFRSSATSSLFVVCCYIVRFMTYVAVQFVVPAAISSSFTRSPRRHTCTTTGRFPHTLPTLFVDITWFKHPQHVDLCRALVGLVGYANCSIPNRSMLFP